VHDRLNVHVVVEPVIPQPHLPHLHVANIQEQMLPNALVPNEHPRRIVGDGIVSEERGKVLPHSFVEVIPVRTLQLLDRLNVFSGANVRLESIQPFSAGRLRSERCRASHSESRDEHCKSEPCKPMSHACPLIVSACQERKM
jgi:hypothetical protein